MDVGRAIVRIQRALIPRLLRLKYDVSAKLFPNESIVNCGYSLIFSHKVIDTLARYGHTCCSGLALYLFLATEGRPDQVDAVRGNWRGHRVLEIGCGLGGGARCLAALLNPKEHVAVDFSPASIAVCQQRQASTRDSLPVTFAVADATELPRHFGGQDFDIVVMVQTAHAIVDTMSLAQGLAHVLCPGGRLMLADHFKERRWNYVVGHLEAAGFVCDRVEDITAAVVESHCLPEDMKYYAAWFHLKQYETAGSDVCYQTVRSE